MDRPTELDRLDWNDFAAQDPFNANFVEGEICRTHGDLYGGLFIKKVDGEKCSQLLYCVPKLHYPFDKQGNWHFPKAKRIERYVKLDGTSIFSFKYHDVNGKEYVSYKTRLLPFVGNSKFGPFLDMWKELLKTQQGLDGLVWKLGMNCAFEVWGNRNPHLIRYDTPLKATLLFVRDGCTILPPSQVPLDGLSFSDTAPFKGVVDSDYVQTYKQAKLELQDNLKEVDDYFVGDEGEVWYLQTMDGKWQLLKCKSDAIEAIHFASGGIGKLVVRATCENAFESWDEPMVENVKQLLLEEFSAHQVEKAHYMIQREIDKARSRFLFKASVISQYVQLGMNILDNKREVMRALSSMFAREQMSKVYHIIMVEITK